MASAPQRQDCRHDGSRRRIRCRARRDGRRGQATEGGRSLCQCRCRSQDHAAWRPSRVADKSSSRTVTRVVIPLWLKIAYTLFLCVLVPAYWRLADAGPRNFLWFSDIALLATGVALWLENGLIVSTMAVGVLL